MLNALGTHESFWKQLQLPMVLCILFKLNYHLKIVTNIIHTY